MINPTIGVKIKDNRNKATAPIDRLIPIKLTNKQKPIYTQIKKVNISAIG